MTHSQDPFTTAATWFPTKSDMNHEATSGINNTLTNTYITEYTANTLKFAGITSIPDSDSNADYAFGYADVTPVPSVKDGTPVNPYTPYTSDKDGGDGFTMFQGCNLLQDEIKLDNQVLIDYITGTLEGVVGEQYAEPYGEGRIVGVAEAPAE